MEPAAAFAIAVMHVALIALSVVLVKEMAVAKSAAISAVEAAAMQSAPSAVSVVRAIANAHVVSSAVTLIA